MTISADFHMTDASDITLPQRAPYSILQQLNNVASFIERAIVSKDFRLIVRALRVSMLLRHRIRGPIITTFIKKVLPAGSGVLYRLLPYLLKGSGKDTELENFVVNSLKATVLPGLELVCYLLVLVFLIDQKQYKQGKECTSAAVNRLKNIVGSSPNC